MGRALEQVQQRLSKTEALLGRLDAGLFQLDAVVRGLPAACQSWPQQPGFGIEFGADFNGGTAGATGATRALQVEEHVVHSLGEPRRHGPWKLYDEKFVLDTKNACNPKDQATWLEDLKDYLSGRPPELDALFSWAEAQPVEIARATGYKGCLDCATLRS